MSEILTIVGLLGGFIALYEGLSTLREKTKPTTHKTTIDKVVFVDKETKKPLKVVRVRRTR